MQPAIAHFAEPYAWLIRGLLEYGWEDISAHPHRFPRQMGFDVRHLLSHQSQSGPLSGIRLVIMAVDGNGIWHPDSKRIECEIRWVRNFYNQEVILLRSEMMALSKEFPYTAETPVYAAGYVTDALNRSIPRFIDDALNGKGVTSIAIESMPNYPSLPASGELVHWLGQRLHTGRDFNSAVREGLWQVQQPQASQQPRQVQQPNQAHNVAPHIQAGLQTQPTAVQAEPIVQQPNLGAPIRIGSGAGHGLRVTSQGLASDAQSVALGILESVVGKLRVLHGYQIVLGVLALVNAAFTAWMIRSGTTVRSADSYTGAVIVSTMIGLIGIGGGAFALMSMKEFAKASRSSLCWLPLFMSVLYPLSFPFGQIIGLWALYLWFRPPVRASWTGSSAPKQSSARIGGA